MSRDKTTLEKLYPLEFGILCASLGEPLYTQKGSSGEGGAGWGKTPSCFYWCSVFIHRAGNLWIVDDRMRESQRHQTPASMPFEDVVRMVRSPTWRAGHGFTPLADDET